MTQSTGKVQSFDATTAPLDPAAIRAFERDGVVCLRGAVGAPWLARIEAGITAALTGASTDLDVVQGKGDTGRFTFSSQAWQQVDQFRDFIFDGPVADLARQVMRSTTLRLFYDFLLIKEGGSASAATPWHQDHSFYPLKGRMVVNSWTALDPIPPETALRFWKGSHRAGTVYRAVNFADPAQPYKHARMEMPVIPDVDALPEAEIITAAMDPGDLLIFTSRTVHGAPGNRLNQRRAGFSLNWVGDDVIYDDVPALDTYRDASLTTGDPLSGPKFPQVRPV